MTSGDGDFSHVHRPDWPAITLLSPTPKRLAKLRQVWEAELERVRRGEPPEEIPPSVPRASLDDLERLAATPTTNDNAAANGSSIAFLLEHQGASCLLTADAFSSVLGAALTGLANERGGNPLDIDVLKLPHHGSKSNVSSALIRLIPARNYVVSTNSELFHHPDDVALARVVTAGPPGLALWFNYLTDATLRWDDRTIKQRYGFESHYPIDGSGGVRIELPGSG